MRRVSSKVSQETDVQDLVTDLGVVEEGSLDTSPIDGVDTQLPNSEEMFLSALDEPLDGPPSADAEEEVGNPSYETNGDDNVAKFNEFDRTGEDSAPVAEVGAAPPTTDTFLGVDPSVLFWLIAGVVAVLFGGLALIAKLTKRTTPDNYRAPVGEVDPEKEVRGQFKPAQRFKKPEPDLEEVAHQSGGGKLVEGQVEPSMQEQSLQGEEEFDFSADLADSEFEVIESDEVVEAEFQVGEVSNKVGSLSARPPESSQDSDFLFVEPTGSQRNQFVQSSAAQFAASELEYAGVPERGFSNDDFTLDEDSEELFDDSEQDMDSILREDDLSIDAAAQSDVELEQEIQASESARDFSDESLDDDLVRANREEEEAVMNLHDDDSELEFDFDLSEEVELRDSDADFDFDLEEDDAPSVASSSQNDTVREPLQQSESPVGQSDDLTEIQSLDEEEVVLSQDAVVEADAGATDAGLTDGDDDSAEFAELFDSIEDQGELELNAPQAAVEQIEAAVDASGQELDEPVNEISAVAENVIEDVEVADVFNLDESVESIDEAVDAIEEPVGNLGLGGVVEAVGETVGGVASDAVGGVTEAVGSVGEMAENALEGATDAASGLSNAAKATAVAAGTAGAAAGGGLLSRLFGWGKKKDAAQSAEEAVEDVVEPAAEQLVGDVTAPADQIAEDAFNDVAEEVSIVDPEDAAQAAAVAADVADVEPEAEFSLGDNEVGFGNADESDEFEFDLEDESPELADSPSVESAVEPTVEPVFKPTVEPTGEAVEASVEEGVASETDSVEELEFNLDDEEEIELGDDFDLVSADSADSDDGEFSLGDPDLGGSKSDGQKEGFSSMDTLREPGPGVAESAVVEPAFSSADTIREPVKKVEQESEGLGIAAMGGTVAAGAAAAVGLDTAIQPAQSEAETDLDAGLEEVASTDDLANINTSQDIASDSKAAELEAKLEQLRQTNQNLEESAKALEEKLEAQTIESEKALEQALEQAQQAQQDHAAKLEESSAGQSELAAELESVKAELAEAKTSAEQAAEAAAEDAAKQAEEAAAEVSNQKDADLERVRAELELAQSSKNALNDELESVKQQLAEAVANQSDDDDGMPTSSLMAAAGIGAAGLLGAKSLMGDDAQPSPPKLNADEDLKKRFEGRLKAERRARKDAQAQLEQAEQQRNGIAKTLRDLKKEMVESATATTPADQSSAVDNSAQLKALESQIERQNEKLKSAQDEKAELLKSVDTLKEEKSELESKAKQADELKSQLQESEIKLKEQAANGEKIAELETEAAQLKVAEEKHGQELKSAQDSIESLNAEKTELEEQTLTLKEKSVELEAAQEKLSAELKSAQESIESLNSEKDELQKQSAELQTKAREVEASKIESLESELAKLKQESQEKQSSVEKQLTELRDSLSQKDKSLAAKTEELQQAEAAKEKAAAETQQLRDTLREETTQLTSQLTSAKSMVASLENEKSQLNTKATQLANQPSAEQTQIIESQAAQIRELQQSAKVAETQSAQLKELSAKIDSLEQTSTRAQEQVKQLNAARESDQQAANSIRQELEAKTRELNSAKEELAKPAQPDPAVLAQIESLKTDLNANSEIVADHRRLKLEMASIQIRHADQLKELLALQPAVQPDSQQPQTDSEAELRTELQAQEKRIMELESENHEAREQLATMAKLRAQLESEQAKAAKGNKATVKQGSAKSKTSAKKTSPSKKKKSGSASESSGKDDLTQIAGIGKVFQGKLNKIGITNFEQIAGWTRKDADAIKDKLGLGDRISDENWIKQAKALLKKKK